jgi:D-glycero-alpha-D-manno-heptose 1-phosphate guanylyltransferase
MPRTEEAIVLAGGRGTRLRGHVDGLPKALAPVAGRPFLAHLLDQLEAAGIRRVLLATGHLAGQVREAIGTRWHSMAIGHSVEDSALGTGGAVALAAQQLQGEEVHVLNGDTFLRFDLAGLEQAVHERESLLGVALAHVDDVGRYGAVLVRDGKACGFQEKGGQGPGLVNAGAYFLTAPAIAALLPRGRAFSFEEEVLLPAARAGQLAAYADTRDFIDIGVPADLQRAQSLLAKRA